MARTPYDSASTAPTPRSGVDDEQNKTDEEPPSLDELEADELLRCVNPNYEFLTWFYAIEDGEVAQYHQIDDYQRKLTTREKAESSINEDSVLVGAATREDLKELQEARA